jgi:hypothetical protein
VRKALVASFCLVMAGVLPAVAVDFDREMYDFDSAIIKVRTTGPMNQGQEEVYIDKGGRVEARHTTTTVTAPFGLSQTQKQISIRRGNMLRVYDAATGTATERDLQKDSEEMMPGANRQDMQAYSESMIRQMGGKRLGTEQVVLEDGKRLKAERISFAQMGTDVWLHKKYPVKSVTKMGNMTMTTEVIAMQLNVPIPTEKLTLPQETQVSQAPSLKDIFGQLNAYKNNPEYQSNQE